jgi:GntR family transcriptional regulator/MocR family aminotransferase
MTDSPVHILFKELIDFDKSIIQPVYIQVSQQIINAIQRRHLTKGTVLPGTRVLGQLLKIHRNTAVAIYEELASQGWV